MEQVFNQFSFVFFSLAGAVLLGTVMWYFKKPANLRLRVAVFAVYLAAVVVVVTLRFPSNTTNINSFEQVEATLENGKPSFVMLYSHFCVNCIAHLPAARALGDELAAQDIEINMIFLDIHTDLGRVAREQLGFTYTPTYIIYDAAGAEVLRRNSALSADFIAEALGQSVGG